MLTTSVDSAAEGGVDDKELEYRSREDNAWYSVRVTLDRRAETLTVRFCHFLDYNNCVFEARNLDTFEKLEDFASRFRPVSLQLQDSQCRDVVEGFLVCACHAFTDHDVKFYDAVVDQVKRKQHSFVNGEEQCLCSFMLCWEHGPNRGLLKEKHIESICIVQSSSNQDPNVASFIRIAREKIETAALKSSSVSHPITANLWRGTRQDADVGGAGNYYTILLENVEKDLSPLTIIEFIHQQTSLTVKAYVFPSLPSELYTRGVIVLDFQKELDDLLDFVNNPNHFIVSSRGRPWVLAKIFSRHDVFRSSIGTLVFATPRRVQKGKSATIHELKVVQSGTGEYKTAKEMRDLLVEFTTYQERLHRMLGFEERKILQPSPTH